MLGDVCYVQLPNVTSYHANEGVHHDEEVRASLNLLVVFFVNNNNK